MPSVGFEPPTPAFEQAKTVHALDRAATMIGMTLYVHKEIQVAGCRKRRPKWLHPPAVFIFTPRKDNTESSVFIYHAHFVRKINLYREANSRLATQEFPKMLWNLKFH
jgi:hypothetical protein